MKKEYLFLILIFIASSCTIDIDISTDPISSEAPIAKELRTSAQEWEKVEIRGLGSSPRLGVIESRHYLDDRVEIPILNTAGYTGFQIKYSYSYGQIFDWNAYMPKHLDFYRGGWDSDTYVVGVDGSNGLWLNLRHIPKGFDIRIVMRGITSGFPEIESRYPKLIYRKETYTASQWSNEAMISYNKYGFYAESGPESVKEREKSSSEYYPGPLIQVTANAEDNSYQYSVSTTFYDEYNIEIIADRVQVVPLGGQAYSFCEVAAERKYKFVMKVKRYDPFTKRTKEAEYTKSAKAKDCNICSESHTVDISRLQYN